MIKRLLVAFCALAVAGLHAAELAKLVSGKAILFVHVPSVPKFLELADKSPLSRTFRDEKVQKFLAPALEKMEFASWDDKQKAATGLSLKELAALPQGEALLVLVAGTEKPVPLLLLDVGEANGTKTENVVKQLLQERKAAGRDITTADETIASVTLHEVTVVQQVPPPKGDSQGEAPPPAEPKTSTDKFHWFVKDGVFAASPDREVVIRVAVALADGAVAEPLAQTDSFLRHLERVKGGGIGAALEFANLAPAVFAKLEQENPQAQKNPLTAPSAILRSLGINEMNTLFGDLRLEDQQMITELGVTYRSFSGLVSLFALGQGPAPQPDFVPENWLAVNSLRLRPADVFAALEALVQGHHPTAGALFTGNLGMVGAKLGFDIKRDLFGSFGDEFVTGSTARPGVPLEKLTAFDIDEIYVLSVTDAKTLARVLDSLVKQADPQDKGAVARKEFGGTTIYSVPLQPDPLRGQRLLNICLWQDRLFISIGTSAPIESAIVTATRKTDGFWQRADVRQALAETPAEAGGFAFQDNRVMISMLVMTFSRLAEMAARDGKQDQGPLVDPSSQPDIADLAKYWAPSHGYLRRDANSLTLYSKLPYVP
ncbi:hypothetical protein [Nibricoccus sp. IMCC34717]|uniref:hypothetical protein n=1 Tax=Nibricoccus sp. IMCC34717 TaxID=3034021 RepID=UPI00384A85A9